LNYIEILHLLEENELFVIAGTQTGIKKKWDPQII